MAGHLDGITVSAPHPFDKSLAQPYDVKPFTSDSTSENSEARKFFGGGGALAEVALSDERPKM